MTNEHEKEKVKKTRKKKDFLKMKKMAVKKMKRPEKKTNVQGNEK